MRAGAREGASRARRARRALACVVVAACAVAATRTRAGGARARAGAGAGAGGTTDAATDAIGDAGAIGDARAARTTPAVEVAGAAATLRDVGAREGEDVVVVAFADAKVLDVAKNWATHAMRARAGEGGEGSGAVASRARVRPVLVALDAETLDAARALGVATYRAEYGDLNDAADHASESWKKFCALMVKELRAVLDAGFDVILSDVDVVWLRDAAPYFKCESGDVDGCEEIRGADVMISSDNLSPTMDWELGARYAMRGIFNTGMMFIRNTRAGKDFLSDWARNLQAKDGAYSKLTTHQQVFNKMAREENAWPGLDVAPGASAKTRVLQSGSPLPSTGSPFAIGALPLRLFVNGHGYFMQWVNRKDGVWDDVKPYAVHATYTFDGSGGEAKRYRFQEVGLWALHDAAGEDEKFLTFELAPQNLTSEEPTIEDHLIVASANVRALVKAFAYAVSLNRTLAIPPLPCRCDKVWSGHDDVFSAKCRYPGANDENYLPGTCPLDHFVSGAKIRKAGGRFVPLASVPSPRAAVFVDAARGERRDDVLLTLGDIDRVPALKFDANHAALSSAVSHPEPWCAECLREACASVLAADVLRRGATRATRGGTAEMWCVSFTDPASSP
jgi:hypothetical protein